jgi:uncharacterized protein YecE (DUF72 family)
VEIYGGAMAAAAASARIGCSGWEYRDWGGGAFYPPGVPRGRWLEHYASVFDTVEVNGTFYRLPAASTLASWARRVPGGFCFALKLSQFGTHRKRLLDPELWMGRFVERARELGPALGPILMQLPPRWRPEPGRLDAALALAPRDLRFAVEVRDPRWWHREVYDVLRRHDAAIVHHDLLAGDPREVTARWAFLRFHGPHAAGGRPYRGAYSGPALAGAARRIRAHLAAGRDVYAYFNNDVGAHAPRDALRLRRLLDQC